MIRKKWDREIDDRTHSEPPGNPAAGRPRFSVAERGVWSRVLLANWLWIVLITVVVTAGAAAVAELQTPIYKAQAEVAVYPTSPSASSALPFVLGTEKGIASSGAVLSSASQSLGMPVGRLERGLSITIPVDSDLLVFAFSDPNPQVAQRAADTVAQAYVAYRTWKAPAVPTTGKTTTPAPTRPATQPVDAAIVTDAALPTAPVSPNRLLIVGVALILGLALGIGMVLLLDQMDDGLRGALDLQAQADAPILGQIPAVRRRRGTDDGVVIIRHPTSTVADAYRNLRTRVMQVAAWQRSNLLLVTSPRGEDKATLAANLAAAMALSGKRVILVSADLRWGRAPSLFGLDNRPGLADVVNGDLKLADAMRWTDVPGLQVLPGGQAYFDPSSVLQSAAFRKALAELQSAADFVVIDAPPVLASADTAALADLGAMLLLVADARVSTRGDVRAVVRELEHVRDDVIGWVLDNVGRARRPSAESITAAMKIRNQRADAGQGVVAAAPVVDADPKPAREPEATSIHREA